METQTQKSLTDNVQESNLNKVSVANMEHTPQNEIYLLSDLKL